ncbi:hypothetical protein M426DRAFT_321332 [Hypoxylon sp. CI-4A]|nr:hypothetical protein M426DRAFT_321332 [Hypoxylon sp. CI-4A]
MDSQNQVQDSTPSMAGENASSKPPVFGQRALQYFDFDPTYRNLNQGSFGSSPRAVRSKLREYQDRTESTPDYFIRYTSLDMLNESREAVAKLLRAPPDTVVLVPNASMGINTILRNMVWADDGRDEMLYFSTVYGACGKTIDYLVDSGRARVAAREIRVTYPLEDDEVLAALRGAIEDSKKDGKRARLCLFDTMSSLPAVRLPFEEITKLCRDAGILSVVDGAQGVGMMELDLSALDADFFVTNCHKWLHVPRSCAVMYVPFRNQAMITSSLPTSHGYVSKSGERFNPLRKGHKSAFVNNFQFVGTLDSSAYLCVKDAIAWREQTFGGEARIIEYIQTLAKEGGKKTAEILGTEILDNKSGTATKCGAINVALPLDPEEASRASDWILDRLMYDYKTFLPIFFHGGRPWVRISAQVFLEIEDFEWAGRVLLELCERVKRGDHLTSA